MMNLTFRFSGIEWSGAISNSRRGSSPSSHLLIRTSHHLLNDSEASRDPLTHRLQQQVTSTGGGLMKKLSSKLNDIESLA